MKKVSFETSIEALSNGSGIYDGCGGYVGGHRSSRIRASFDQIRRLLTECFDCNFEGIHPHTRMTIICSPHAFVNWQIERNRLGNINTFRNLNVKFVEIEQNQLPAPIVIHSTK